MEAIECKVCGYLSINGQTPEKCPVCGASSFEKKEDAIKEPADPLNLTDLEKKHIPVVKVSACGDCCDGSSKVSVTMGEIIHPMQKEHFIEHIDFYHQKEFVARIKLSADKISPSGSICFKVSGEVEIIEHCNIHGSWMASLEI